MKAIADKFTNIPSDPDTRILWSKRILVGGFDALFQGWNWDGLAGISVIFSGEDVNHLSDTEIVRMVATEGLDRSFADAMLGKSRQPFVFVNATPPK